MIYKSGLKLKDKKLLAIFNNSSRIQSYLQTFTLTRSRAELSWLSDKGKKWVGSRLTSPLKSLLLGGIRLHNNYFFEMSLGLFSILKPN